MAMADKNTNYAQDDMTTADDTQMNVTQPRTTAAPDSGAEPATAHDTTEGGILGAVGGAVVGLFAGGPIGAVIGAVVGGAASAGAVNVVDRHDHDYNPNTDGGHSDTVLTDTQPAGATMAGEYSTNTTSTNTTSTSASSASAAPSYTANLAQTGMVGTNNETVIPIVEEELEVGKRQVQSGGAHIHTSVIETPVEQTVNLREEHVNVTRHAVNEPVMDNAAAFKEQSFEVTETDEVPVVSKSARVVEEVVVGKTAAERTETVRDTVRRTEVEVDDLGADSTRR